ncbi:MAG: hypothetical protein GY725_10735 [bacterium]|nr:hypothetical protein [bacterium]
MSSSHPRIASPEKVGIGPELLQELFERAEREATEGLLPSAQIAWVDPRSGISLGYVTNGHDRNAVRMARRSVGISSRAAKCAGH